MKNLRILFAFIVLGMCSSLSAHRGRHWRDRRRHRAYMRCIRDTKHTGHECREKFYGERAKRKNILQENKEKSLERESRLERVFTERHNSPSSIF